MAVIAVMLGMLFLYGSIEGSGRRQAQVGISVDESGTVLLLATTCRDIGWGTAELTPDEFGEYPALWSATLIDRSEGVGVLPVAVEVPHYDVGGTPADLPTDRSVFLTSGLDADGILMSGEVLPFIIDDLREDVVLAQDGEFVPMAEWERRSATC